MKKALLLTGLLLVLVAPLATADGVNLAWGTECWGLLDSPSNLVTFACLSNTVPASWKMTTSFMVDADIPDYNSFNAVIRGVSEAGAIPDWWELSAAATDCRYAAVSNVSFNPAYAGVSDLCGYPFAGTAMGGGAYGYIQPQVIQINGLYAVAGDGAFLAGGTETFGYTVSIKNTKTVGTGSCTGCLFGMVFGLNYVVITKVSDGDIDMIDTVIPGGNQCLIWQRGFNMAAAGDYAAAVQPCNAPVPARNTTWGQVKSLYR